MISKKEGREYAESCYGKPGIHHSIEKAAEPDLKRKPEEQKLWTDSAWSASSCRRDQVARWLGITLDQYESLALEQNRGETESTIARAAIAKAEKGGDK